MAADITLAAGAVGASAQLVAATVFEVDFTDDLSQVQVISSAANTVDTWFSLDGSTPVANGTNSYYLPPSSVRVEYPITASGTVVKLISTGTPLIRIERAI